MRPRHAYVHVPFCRHRCGYCDFSLVVGREDLLDRYFAALGRELGRVGDPLELDTLYLGGGTPSHLGPDGLHRLFDLLRRHLRPAEGAEVTVEANPLDVTESFAAACRDRGVTRVSLGGQSFDDATLRALDRDHAPDDVRNAVAHLREQGLAINVDLMTAAPGQSLGDVARDLDAVATVSCGHVSVYCLTLEKGTAFDARRRKGLLGRIDEAEERAMFELAIDRLEAAGYGHYEVSNFARPGFRCRHNEATWDCRPWEAFGPAAARFDGRTRATNHRSTTTWIRRMLAEGDATADVDAMTAEEAARERIVVGLRRRDGIERAAFEAASGFALDAIAGPAIRRWVRHGLADDDGRRVRLTRAGLLVSDGLWGDVLRPR